LSQIIRRIMKKLYSVLTITLALSAFNGLAQEDQATIIDKVGDTPLTSYVINYDRSSQAYTFAGCCSDNDVLSLSTYDDLKVATITRTYESGKTNTKSYYVDEEVYPVTFIAGRLRGNPEQQKRLKVIDYSEEKRLVVVGEWMYILKWKSRTDWVIEDVYGMYELKGVKKVKEAFAAAKKMENANHEETLKAYLEKAFAKQDELVVEWRKTNAEKVQRRIDNDQILTNEINGRNAEFWASDEGQAIKKRNEMAAKSDAEDAKSEVKCIYKGKGTALFGYERNSTGGSKGAGQSTVCDCTKDVYIYRNDNGTFKRAEKVSSAGSNCGGSIEVE